MLKAPNTDELQFVVNIYKDMEYADEIEFSNAFDCYKEALKFYNEQVIKSNGEYFVELILDVDTEDRREELQLAHNETEESEDYETSRISIHTNK